MHNNIITCISYNTYNTHNMPIFIDDEGFESNGGRLVLVGTVSLVLTPVTPV